ncbi:non-ribosomal peptide synthetase/type I polyketide synthase [Oleiphilus messinensis]|uniref:non-ribosomal peptide synthetase/type I polyketide synthase n=1 Tax=Oleiphilus messinensis TaxID=141451 RepID=UPI0018DF7901|nr:non-ribosomal peptide synthetase/type I polyketide synthase [Oleiphilus messinensis]
MEIELTPGQHAIWMVHILHPNTGIYNSHFVFDVPESLDIVILKRALEAVVKKHPPLRTLYKQNAHGAIVQVVYDDWPLQFEEIDVGDASDIFVDDLLNQYLQQPFELEREVAMRWVYIKRNNRQNVLAHYVHHINMDLWACMVLFNDLKKAYSSILVGNEPNTEISKPCFYDFVENQNQTLSTSKTVDLRKFWHEHLKNMPQVLEIPPVKPRPPIHSCNKEYFRFRFHEPVITAFNALAASKGHSLFSQYLTLFQLLCYRYTGQTDLGIGCPTAGRDSTYQGVYGYFTNAVIFRAVINPDSTFDELMEQQNSWAQQSIDMQEYPFPYLAREQIEQRDSSRSPLVQISFVWENINRFENRQNPLVFQDSDSLQAIWDMGDMGCWNRHIRLQQLDDFDLTFKIYKYQDDFIGGIEYNTDLYSLATIQAIAGHYQELMESVTRCPDLPVKQLSMLSCGERNRIFNLWNQASVVPKRERFLTEYVRDLAKKYPNNMAVLCGKQGVTYAELEFQSSKIANFLLSKGLQRGDVVGVYLERRVEVVSCFLGILKANAAYLPLDVEYPRERLRFIIDDAKPKFILTLSKLCSNPELSETQTAVAIDAPDFYTSEIKTELVPAMPNQLAYVIYTSGSTGLPKGVLIEHRGLNNLIYAKREVYQLSKKDRVLQFATLNFDASISEIVLSLSVGATLVMAEKKDVLGEKLLSFLYSNRITCAILPPATLAVIEPDFDRIKSLHTLIVAGDVCSAELARKWSKGRRFINAYGPTESTVWATFAEVDGSCIPSIGVPIPNTQVYILDAEMNPVPVGVPGEIFIGGLGVSRGYLNRPDLTKEKFISNPNGRYGGILYRTGDLARYSVTGSIDYLGRLDHQVKIRGFRVELGEIEAVCSTYPNVHDVLVLVRTRKHESANSQDLIAYIVRKAGTKLDENDIRAHLTKRLPDYMVPSAFVVLDAFPLTANEKIDRNALPPPKFEDDKLIVSHLNDSYRSPTESILEKAWKDVLQVDSLSKSDNFFELGGHSLLMAKLYNLLPDGIKESVALHELFQYPTIESLAYFIDHDDQESAFIEDDAHIERFRLKRRLLEHLVGAKIAIVGMAGRFPGADDVEQFWDNICNKRESIRFYSNKELEKAGVPESLLKKPNYVRAKGALNDIKSFDAKFFNMSPREAQITDPQHRLFLEVAWEALENSNCVPGDTDAAIGIYGGSGMNEYLRNHIGDDTGILEAVGDYPIAIGNDKDFLCTRVSYKLNLNGPAMVLQTACSTSLVAVHNACQALNQHECDVALAGGVSLGKLESSGYLYQEGMIMSPDGHCRPFDEEAAGTVSGQGAGVVVLKRLQDALDSHDYIYGIIEGSAVNNDGSMKVGYTTPSVEGQAKAIALALASANVDPTRIGYVEAHGTGTKVGDPIEVRALSKAFGLKGEKGQFCALGSVKANVGHLDAASGIAGLISAVKAVQTGKIPPLLNYKNSNLAINFRLTPFYVNTELKDWPEQQGDRFAAVSSFGIGGTNAHVVVRQPPQIHHGEAARRQQILTLSAKSPSALEQMTNEFKAYLKENERSLNFADICYSLQVGRTRFPYRRYLLCSGFKDAQQKLAQLDPAFVITEKYKPIRRKIAFMFSGQGSQYVGMGKQLFEVEIQFRETIEKCRLLLMDRFVYTFDRLEDKDLRAQSDKIHETNITQPALFIFEFALAKMLMSWGIEPDLMIGHSIGEYVAAHLAGVFSLEDALELVAIRGQLIVDELKEKKGCMLSVQTSEDSLKSLIQASSQEDRLSIAAINGESRCVVSGDVNAISLFKKELDRQKIASRILKTSHAFHSYMMEPVVERFKASVAKRRLNPPDPSRPFISSVTGKLITDEQATDPEYWAQQLRNEVRFHDGLSTLLDQREDDTTGMLLIEVGPGKVLSTLARQHPSLATQDEVFSTTRHPQGSKVDDTELLLKLVARLWMLDIRVDWNQFYANRFRGRVPLPTYPFDKKPYWIPAHTQKGIIRSTVLEADSGPVEGVSPLRDEENAILDPTELAVLQIWQQCLGHKKINRHDSFFDIGGDSLIAVNVVNKLMERFDVPIESHVLINNSSVAKLTLHIKSITQHPERVREAGALSATSPLVMIQKGDGMRDEVKRPIFLVHPIGGEVYFYRDLARYLGVDQAVYAFQAHSLVGKSAPYTSVVNMATDYVAELLSTEAEPPYILGGSSFGGMVAYEMAQQLHRRNIEVQLVVMIDTPAPEDLPDTIRDSASVLEYMLQGALPLDIHRLRQIESVQEQIDYVIELAQSADKSEVLPPYLSVPLLNTWIAHQQATFAYQPQPYDGPVMYFRHTEPLANLPPRPHESWQKWTGDRFWDFKMEGNHITMNFHPHVKTLAKCLKEKLVDMYLARIEKNGA